MLLDWGPKQGVQKRRDINVIYYLTLSVMFLLFKETLHSCISTVTYDVYW